MWARAKTAARRLPWGWIVPLLVPPVLGVAFWLASAEHKLLPGFRGCSLVREPAAQIDCYGREARAIARRDGSQAAARAIERRARTDRDLRAECHLVQHQVGEPAGRRAARTGKAIPDFGATSFCRDGYVHGFFIGYVEEAPDGEATAKVVASYCIRQEAEHAAINCAHSYGHVVMRADDADDGMLVERCSGIDFGAVSDLDGAEAGRLNARARFDCMYGGYMERSLQDMRADRKRPLDNCRTVPAAAVDACYSFLPGRVLQVTGSTDRSTRACEQAIEAGRAACAVAVGRSMGAGACSRFEDGLRGACVGGAKAPRPSVS